MSNSRNSSSKPGRTTSCGLRCGAAIFLVLAAVVAAGCGSSGSTDPTTGGASSQAAAGTQSFAKDTKSKEIVEFGQESAAPEREAASAILTENLKARQAAEFASQCSSLGKAGLETVVGKIGAGGAEIKKAQAKCPTTLKGLAEPLATSNEARKNTLSGPISALRVEGTKGYALYHGNDGKDWAMPMEKEGGKWLVASISTTELN